MSMIWVWLHNFGARCALRQVLHPYLHLILLALECHDAKEQDPVPGQKRARKFGKKQESKQEQTTR